MQGAWGPSLVRELCHMLQLQIPCATGKTVQPLISKRMLQSQSDGFSSSHVWMWELDHKEGWEPKNWCFWTGAGEVLGVPLDCKEIQLVNPKGNVSWIFIGRTDAEAPILWPPNAKSWPWCWESLKAEGKRQDKMVGWHDKTMDMSEQAPGDGEGQGSLSCFSPWGGK